MVPRPESPRQEGEHDSCSISSPAAQHSHTAALESIALQLPQLSRKPTVPDGLRPQLAYVRRSDNPPPGRQFWFTP
jgi:hypothetical protein